MIRILFYKKMVDDGYRWSWNWNIYLTYKIPNLDLSLECNAVGRDLIKDHLNYKCYPYSGVKFWTVNIVLNLSCSGQL